VRLAPTIDAAEPMARLGNRQDHASIVRVNIGPPAVDTRRGTRGALTATADAVHPSGSRDHRSPGPLDSASISSCTAAGSIGRPRQPGRQSPQRGSRSRSFSPLTAVRLSRSPGLTVASTWARRAGPIHRIRKPRTALPVRADRAAGGTAGELQSGARAGRAQQRHKPGG
jgi:hypothetical protein